jgi:NitT/TauT family transport system substrate-binding protein
MSPQPPASAAFRRRLLAFGLPALAIAAAAAALATLLRQRSPLEVAITSWPGYEYFYLAEQKSLGRGVGLDLRTRQFSSLVDQRQAFERGDVPAMATTLAESIAVCQEAPVKCPLLVLVLDESVGADRVIATADITSPLQLIGRRVGLERSVLAEYILMRSFGERKTPLSALKLRFDGPEAIVAALRDGQLDAVVTYSPHDEPLLQDPRFHTVFSTAAIPGEVVDVLAVDPEVARRQPDQVKSLVQTWWQARAYAASHPGEAVAIMAGREQIKPEQFRRSEQGLHYPGSEQQASLLASDGPLARGLVRKAALMRASGRIDADAPLPQLSSAFLETR